jgi:cell division septation protein DedD
MNINYKEPQFELFPANSATLEDINKPKFLLATLTLSTENLVILVILAIMIALFSFSIGVERGRVLAAQSLDEKAAAAWNVGGRRLAPAPVAVSAAKSTTVAGSTVKTGNSGAVHSAKAAAPAVTSSGQKWTVQLGSYKNENYAQQEALGLKAKGYPTFIVKSKDFYLVCIGQFASQVQANSFFAKLQAKYQGGQVRRF